MLDVHEHASGNAPAVQCSSCRQVHYLSDVSGPAVSLRVLRDLTPLGNMEGCVDEQTRPGGNTSVCQNASREKWEKKRVLKLLC